MTRNDLFLLILALVLAACSPAAIPSPLPVAPTFGSDQSPTSPPVTLESPSSIRTEPSGTAALNPSRDPVKSSPEATPAQASTLILPHPLSEEAILILSPGPDSRLTNPIRVSGIVGPISEGTLTVRVISADGQEIAIAPAQIDAESGQRGPFSAVIGISVDHVMPGFIQVYTASRRDGGLTHLTAFGVTLAPDGAADIKPLDSYLERITISQPAPDQTISGGSVRVEGLGLATFEGTLVIEIFGPEGTVIGSQSLVVNSPESGQAAPFSTEVKYSAAEGQGRILVRDPSPIFDGNMHVSSTEVNLLP